MTSARRSRMLGARWVGALWGASHPGPTLVVTVLAVALGVAAGLELWRVAVLAGAVLAGQLSVGISNELLSWAQIWQQKGRDAETIRLLTIDPHSPNEFRCNQIVRNVDEFYTAFEVTASDALWLDADKRVTIW